MWSTNILVFIPIALALSALAALAAFLITYEEWTNHYTDKREPMRHALNMAVAAFFIFAVLAMLAIVVISQLVSIR